FFSQAEDGIRARYVTGVQTCALPISVGAIAMNAGTTINAGSGTITMSAPGNIALTGLSTTNNSAAAVSVSSSAGAITDAGDTTRSEERRVGKECRTREAGRGRGAAKR